MAYYNLSNVTGTTNILDMAIGVNQLSGFWFGRGLIISIFIILFMSFKQAYPTKTCLLASSSIAMILAFLLRAINMIPDLDLFILGILAAGSLFLNIIDKDE